jgi:thiosulfate/3-mercaptopyruvate sulfurtransferase
MEYAHPEVLVDTQWVMEHLNDSKVRIAEVNYDPNSNYVIAHIPGAVLIDWASDISDPMSKNIVLRRRVRNSCKELELTMILH